MIFLPPPRVSCLDRYRRYMSTFSVIDNSQYISCIYYFAAYWVDCFPATLLVDYQEIHEPFPVRCRLDEFIRVLWSQVYVLFAVSTFSPLGLPDLEIYFICHDLFSSIV